MATGRDGFDPQALEQLKQDLDAESAKEIIASYLQEAPQLLLLARTSLAKRDAEGFRRAAHTLKSTSLHVGAVALSEAAKALEEGSKQGRLPADAAGVERLQALFDAVRPVLMAWDG